jgi:hypothetical protein
MKNILRSRGIHWSCNHPVRLFGVDVNSGIALLEVSFIAMKYLPFCFERRQKRLNQPDFAIASQTKFEVGGREIYAREYILGIFVPHSTNHTISVAVQMLEVWWGVRG